MTATGRLEALSADWHARADAAQRDADEQQRLGNRTSQAYFSGMACTHRHDAEQVDAEIARLRATPDSDVQADHNAHTNLAQPSLRPWVQHKPGCPQFRSQPPGVVCGAVAPQKVYACLRHRGHAGPHKYDSFSWPDRPCDDTACGLDAALAGKVIQV